MSEVTEIKTYPSILNPGNRGWLKAAELEVMTGGGRGESFTDVFSVDGELVGVILPPLLMEFSPLKIAQHYSEWLSHLDPVRLLYIFVIKIPVRIIYANIISFWIDFCVADSTATCRTSTAFRYWYMQSRIFVAAGTNVSFVLILRTNGNWSHSQYDIIIILQFSCIRDVERCETLRQWGAAVCLTRSEWIVAHVLSGIQLPTMFFWLTQAWSYSFLLSPNYFCYFRGSILFLVLKITNCTNNKL